MSNTEWRIHSKPGSAARLPFAVIRWLGSAIRRAILFEKTVESIVRIMRIVRSGNIEQWLGMRFGGGSVRDAVTLFVSAHGW